MPPGMRKCLEEHIKLHMRACWEGTHRFRQRPCSPLSPLGVSSNQDHNVGFLWVFLLVNAYSSAIDELPLMSLSSW